MEQLIVLFDGIIVILAILVCYYSLKLITCCFGATGFQSGYWLLLPAIFIYALVTRILALLIASDILPREMATSIAAAQIVFWIGAFVFVFGLYKSTQELMGQE